MKNIKNITRDEFDKIFLNKKVSVVLFDGEYMKGTLYSTNDFAKLVNYYEPKNYYFVANNIRENTVRFRKSHIRRIRFSGDQNEE